MFAYLNHGTAEAINRRGPRSIRELSNTQNISKVFQIFQNSFAVGLQVGRSCAGLPVRMSSDMRRIPVAGRVEPFLTAAEERPVLPSIRQVRSESSLLI